MAWPSLASRIAQLPLVLAGPILRRTEAHAVSVWIACKEEVNLLLTVSEAGQTPTTILQSEPTSTIPLGDNLHVAVVTAGFISSPGTPLLPGRIYHYDIEFLPGRNLATPGVIGGQGSSPSGVAAISYGSSGLPSLMLPAADTGDLRLAHASCRKPHGGETDALRALDLVLESTNDDPTKRPQLLCLTGDQIYADDVDNLLMLMLIDGAKTLMGWDETLPALPVGTDLGPGRRQKLANANNLTSDHAESHLFKLGEFYAMYLFAWSPDLWPDTLPGFDDLHPGASTHIPSPALQWALASGHLPAMLPTKDYREFLNSKKVLEHFRTTLGFARKVLANIPAYMMFDDHEVTDDWFLNGRWADDALRGQLSRRVLQNGLAAFAVFQGWGNTPDRFESALTGGRVLDSLVAINRERGDRQSDWDAVAGSILPKLFADGSGQKLDGGLRWDFVIDFPAFRLNVLDTRTRRGFPKPKNAPALIALDDLPNQIPHSAIPELTVLVAPAPVTGHYLLEEIVQPGWGFFGGPAAADYEAWKFDTAGFEGLLERLAPLRRVLVLSGDVHYAFSSSIQYWNHRGGTLARAAYAQLCSSSLKNEAGLTNFIASRFLGPRVAAEYLGWAKSGSHVRVSLSGIAIGDKHVGGSPAVWRLRSRDERPAPGHTPEWRYRIIFAKDDRDEASRGIPAPAAIPAEAHQRALFRHRRKSDWDAQRVVVGRDNLGLVSFDWGSIKTAQHDLWYVPKNQNPSRSVLFPYTRHKVSLTVPTDNTPIPGGS